MKYMKFNAGENEYAAQRRELAVERLNTVLTEETVSPPLCEPFREMAAYLLYVDHLAELQQAGTLRDADEAIWRERNERLWGDVLSRNGGRTSAATEKEVSERDIKTAAGIEKVVFPADGKNSEEEWSPEDGKNSEEERSPEDGKSSEEERSSADGWDPGKKMKNSYDTCWLNPAYAVSRCGTEAGQLVSFLYSELQAGALYAYEGRVYALVMLEELFIGVYNCFENVPDSEMAVQAMEEARNLIYWFFHDYSEIFTGWQVREMVDPDYDFCTGIIMNSNLTDLRYLYFYGLPIGENERKTAAYVNSLPADAVQSMADTYTEGYRIGFEVTGKDLSKKKTVEIRYAVGFERVMRAAIRNFAAMGLRPTIALQPFTSFRGKCVPSGAYSTSISRQFAFDHREDRSYYFDKSFVERRLETLKAAFETNKKQAAVYAGPAVLEVFGEEPFSPESKAESLQYNAGQQKLNVHNAAMSGEITNHYIKGEERSFTIIAYPIPEIGENFEEIFHETLKINTLDYKTYQRMQQKLIDVLDGADHVEIRGRCGNETNLSVAIRPLFDPEHETAFENCVADVNIPVGEVFTSPVLAGTNGLLHVSEVFLNGLKFVDLRITFRDGMVSDYSCANFESEEKNKKYIKDNVLMHHETLPMGEFAIGTNTTAYRMGMKYDIMGRLPILIAEKCGPHFAVGDTCYSHAEDTPVFNPDGKEIVARDNEVSIRRKEDPAAAYLNCHTDITIPYHELDTIIAVCPDGERRTVIAGGRFAVPGTEELNVPLEEA